MTRLKPIPRWPDDFTYLGATAIPAAPGPQSVNGDSPYGKGLTLILEGDGTLSLLTGSWNPQVVLRWTATRNADGSFSTPAVFKQNLGSVPMRGELYGLHWDRPSLSLLVSSNSPYDGDPAINQTLGRAVLDPATGKLVPKGFFSFANRPDKHTQGGVTALPDWFQKTFGVGRLAAGHGGYWSVIANGPDSMGPALTAFDLPAMDALLGSIGNRPLLGYPFSSSLSIQTPAAERDADYIQTYGWGWWPKSVPSEPGWWVPGDSLWQGGAFVDTEAVSGYVCVPFINNGCNWYGSNAVPPTLPSCAGYAGKAASLNSERAHHWIYIYDPNDLGAVALGLKAQHAIQAAQRVRLDLPGVTQPLTGWPNVPRMVTGVSFESTSGLFAVMIRNAVSGGHPTVFWYQVRRSRPYAFMATATVQAGSETEATALVQSQVPHWTLVP